MAGIGFPVIRMGFPITSGGASWTPAKLDNIITWEDTTNPGNTVVSNAFDVLLDLSGNGKNLSAASAGVRPAQYADPMLGNRYVALADGVDDYLKNASITRPKTYAILYRMPSYTISTAILSYGAAYPLLWKGNVSYATQFFGTASASVQCSSAPLSDGYYHLVIADDDGSTTVTLSVGDPTCTAWTQQNSAADVAARAASPAGVGLFAETNGTLPGSGAAVMVLMLSDLMTAAEKLLLLDYCRRQYVEQQALPRMTFVGTKTLNSDAQPRPYPAAHDGLSGETLAQQALRMVGSWSGAGTTIASGNAPAVGARGSCETITTTNGSTGCIPVILVGTNDATTGTIDLTAWDAYIRRMWAIGSVGPGSIQRIVVCTIPQRVNAAVAARISTFNAGIVSLVATMVSDGIPVTICDLAAGYNTGTMILSGDLHSNLLGCQYEAQTIYDTFSAASLLNVAYKPWLIGDSYTAGGSNLIPQVTAQYRPWLAKLLAAGGY